MRARALQQIVQEQRTVIEGGDTARSDALPGASVRRLGRARARRRRRRSARADRAGPRRGSAVPVRRGGAAEPLAHEPRQRRGVRAAPARVVERHLKLSAHRRGVRPGAVRPARAAGASVLLERLGLARGVGARAEQPEHVLRGLEHRGRGVRGVRSAWDVRGGGRGGACQKSLRAARRGHGPLCHHLAVAQVRLDAVGGGEVVPAAHLVHVVAHQRGRAVPHRGVEQTVQARDVARAVVVVARRRLRRRARIHHARGRARGVHLAQLGDARQVRGEARHERLQRSLARGGQARRGERGHGVSSTRDPGADRSVADLGLARFRAAPVRAGGAIGGFHACGSSALGIARILEAGSGDA